MKRRSGIPVRTGSLILIAGAVGLIYYQLNHVDGGPFWNPRQAPVLQYDDRRYQLTELLSAERPIDVTDIEGVPFRFEPGKPGFHALAALLDSSIRSVHAPADFIDRVRFKPFVITLKQEGAPVTLQLRGGGYVEVLRPDGETELCRADDYLYAEVRVILKQARD